MQLSNINRASSIRKLTITIWAVLIIGFIISLYLYFHEGVKNGFGDIDLTSDGFAAFTKKYSSSIVTIKATLELLIAAATVGGIVIAVRNYINTSYASAIANHISNFRVFSDFLNQEISKLDRVNIKSINIFYWYNKIFPESRNGIVEISREYLDSTEEINRVIIESNYIYKSSKKPDFSYKKHQERMIEALQNIGIRLDWLNRNDFYMAEEQILKLVDLVNIEFCGLDSQNTMEKREYI